MTEIMKCEPGSLSRLDMLTQEMNGYMQAISYNLMQVARVLKEARDITERGQWSAWVRDFGFTERKAELYIQTYERFSDNATLAKVQRSSLFKMLSLPAGDENAFAEANDLENMSAREVGRAVKEWNAAKAPQETDLVQEVAADYQATIDRQKREIEEKQAEMERLIDQQNDAMTALREATARNCELQKRLAGNEEDIDALQAALDRTNNALAAAQSAKAQQEAKDGLEDKLTVSALAAAVRQFMGACVQLPTMQRQFAAMDEAERNDYALWLATIRNFVLSAESTVATYACGGDVQ